MATLTVSITAGVTTSQTMTFSGPDATRIMNAYKAIVDPNGDQAGLNGRLATLVKQWLMTTVSQAETVIPAPPTIT